MHDYTEELIREHCHEQGVTSQFSDDLSEVTIPSDILFTLIDNSRRSTFAPEPQIGRAIDRNQKYSDLGLLYIEVRASPGNTTALAGELVKPDTTLYIPELGGCYQLMRNVLIVLAPGHNDEAQLLGLAHLNKRILDRSGVDVLIGATSTLEQQSGFGYEYIGAGAVALLQAQKSAERISYLGFEPQKKVA